MNRKNIIHIVSGIIMLALLVGAYLLGKSQQQVADNSALLTELDSLRSHESDAAVIKRVSQQMESIAYQQKAISEKQRDKAEEQSKLAMEMRDRAELESKAARDAENDAVLAAQLAQEQRLLAMAHQKTAEVQRNQAIQAKNIADTLTYRTLGRTLGNTASIQYDSDPNLADLLALKGWTYLHQYGGNTYQPEVFKALSTCTGTRWDIKMPHQGAVTGVCSLGDGSFVGVSDYGEVEYCKSGEQKATILFYDKTYEFTAVSADKKYIYAVSKHGPILRIDYQGHVLSTILPANKYKTILQDNNGTLTIASDQAIYRYDKKNGTVTELAKLAKNLTAITYTGSLYYLFFADNSCMEMTSDGRLKSRKPFASQLVTCAYYDREDSCLFLGHSSGNISYVNCYGLYCANLVSHTSAITMMTSTGGILVSGAYDKIVTIWNLNALSLNGSNNFRQSLTAKNKEVIKSVNQRASEWLTPVTYSYSGWPLSCCVTKSGIVLMGISNGTMQSMNISTQQMAAILEARKPESKVPEEEWMKYSISVSEKQMP